MEAMEELRRAASTQFCPRCVGALERVLPPEILADEAARHELLAAS
jgi:HD-GYP domain-containing protein (c-di-GMP phosphodiesterase class II)